MPGLVHRDIRKKDEGVKMYECAPELDDPANQGNLRISYLEGGYNCKLSYKVFNERVCGFYDRYITRKLKAMNPLTGGQRYHITAHRQLLKKTYQLSCEG